MVKIVATNRKAFHDYEIVEKFEAGIALLGREVKSLRAGRMSLKGGWVSIRGTGGKNSEVWLENVNIPDYPQSATRVPYDPQRPRKLLLKKSEISRLIGKIAQKNFTLVPLECYFNDKGLAKVEIALVKGKREYDRREEKKRKDIEREMRRGFGEKFKI